MEARKKRPRRFKKEAQGVQASPPEPPICCSLELAAGELGDGVPARRLGEVLRLHCQPEPDL
jgi:hypothetical protein